MVELARDEQQVAPRPMKQGLSEELCHLVSLDEGAKPPADLEKWQCEKRAWAKFVGWV